MSCCFQELSHWTALAQRTESSTGRALCYPKRGLSEENSFLLTFFLFLCLPPPAPTRPLACKQLLKGIFYPLVVKYTTSFTFFVQPDPVTSLCMCAFVCAVYSKERTDGHTVTLSLRLTCMCILYQVTDP